MASEIVRSIRIVDNKVYLDSKDSRDDEPFSEKEFPTFSKLYQSNRETFQKAFLSYCMDKTIKLDNSTTVDVSLWPYATTIKMLSEVKILDYMKLEPFNPALENIVVDMAYMYFKLAEKDFIVSMLKDNPQYSDSELYKLGLSSAGNKQQVMPDVEK